MTGTTVCQAETSKDSSYTSEGGQWPDFHGFNFLEYGIDPVRIAPVIAVQPHHCDDFLDFNLAERCAIHIYYCCLSRSRRETDIVILPPGVLIKMNRSS